jgi:hypothetical protein
MSQGLNFPKEVSSTYASRAWTLVSTHRSWFSSRRSWEVNWFSKQSAIALAFLFGWYVICIGPRTAIGAFGPYLLISNFAIDHNAWDVTSQFPTFISHCSNAFLWDICLIILAAQLTVVLHAGSWVACCSVLNLILCFSRLSRPGRCLSWSESVSLFVDSLYAKTIEAVKSRATLSASCPS